MGCNCHDDDPRRRRVLRQLARAHASGALAGVAAGGGLGSLEPGGWSYEPAALDAETESFDGRLNAWMNDYAAAASRLPAALVQQVDAFIERWRELRNSSYFFTGARGQAILAMQAEWNRLRDQVASHGAPSSIAPSTVTVGGREVRADQIPPGQSTFDRIEHLAKWGAIIVGGAAAIKVATDLGAFKKLGGLIAARGR
jgi:hypothetical protein